MAYCTDCGANIPGGARFCPGCGTAAPTVAPGPKLDKTAEKRIEPAPVATPFSRPIDPAPAGSPVSPIRSAGGIGWIVPIMVVLALAMIGLLMWSQRDGGEAVTSEDVVQQPAGGDGERTGQRDDARADTSGGDVGGRDVGGGDVRGGNAGPAIDTPVVAGAMVSTSASAIDLAFYVDRASALDRFPGAIRVSGTIATMVTPAPNPALSLEGRTPSSEVIVNFPAGSRALLAPLRKGMAITVLCDRASGVDGVTMLYGCSI